MTVKRAMGAPKRLSMRYCGGVRPQARAETIDARSGTRNGNDVLPRMRRRFRGASTSRSSGDGGSGQPSRDESHEIASSDDILAKLRDQNAEIQTHEEKAIECKELMLRNANKKAKAGSAHQTVEVVHVLGGAVAELAPRAAQQGTTCAQQKIPRTMRATYVRNRKYRERCVQHMCATENTKNDACNTCAQQEIPRTMRNMPPTRSRSNRHDAYTVNITHGQEKVHCSLIFGAFHTGSKQYKQRS